MFNLKTYSAGETEIDVNEEDQCNFQAKIYKSVMNSELFSEQENLKLELDKNKIKTPITNNIFTKSDSSLYQKVIKSNVENVKKDNEKEINLKIKTGTKEDEKILEEIVSSKVLTLDELVNKNIEDKLLHDKFLLLSRQLKDLEKMENKNYLLYLCKHLQRQQHL